MVALISPPSRTYSQRLPLALMHLSSCLTERGIDNEIIDIKQEKHPFLATTEQLTALNPKVVGITCCATEIFEVKDLCDWIGKHLPDSEIVLGGPHPTSKPQHFVDVGVDFDYIVIGEGEKVLCDLIQKGKSVPGIAYMENGRIVYTEPRELIEDLDALPMPAYDKIDMEYYAKPSIWSVRFVPLSAVGVFGSRGCPYHCKFCVAHAVFGRKIRRYSPERATEIVKHLVETYNLDGVYWNDECFTAHKQWTRDVCAMLKDLNILWGCQTRAQLLNSDLVKTMKESGCFQIDFGFESGSDRLLKVMNKGTTTAHYRKAVKACRKAGIRHLANMMINIPTETLEDIRLSTSLVKELRPNVLFWNVYCPFPGVSFGSDMALKDLTAEANRDTDLLEKKYKFGTYPDTIKDVLRWLRSSFPAPPEITLSTKPSYYLGWLRFFSFLWSFQYWRVILKSKRFWQYLSLGRLAQQKAMR